MDYILDPELAAAAAALPRMELSDLAAARESGQLLFAQPKYDAGVPLTVRDVAVTGRPGTAEVSVRLYASAEHSNSVPALLYLHSCAYAMGGLALK